MAHVLHSFWRRHRWTALRSLLLVALLHRLHFLTFLAASSPVWLLTAFLLGAVLVYSEPNVPLAAASEDEDRRHKPVTGASGSGTSSDDDNESSVTSMEDHLVVDKAEEEEVVKAAVAWTADDEHSIQSIGSLELEKLMSRRTTHRNLIDLDVHIPAVMAPRTKNPLDLHHHSSSYYDDGHGAAAAAAPGSAPSSLLGQHTNPFDDIHIQQQRERDRDPDEEDTEDEKKAAILRRHESFTAGAAPLARPSRFKPYFVADVPEGDAGGRDAGRDYSNSNSNSSSPSSSTASDHHTRQEAAVKVEEAPAASTSPCAWDGKGNGMVMAVDVELISDSSDDDMSLQGDDATGGRLNNARDHSDDDEEDSFEVESITQQVAAGTCSSAFWRSLSYCWLQMQIDVM
jgi:hypothetical protein